jgi:hypothetical protein
MYHRRRGDGTKFPATAGQIRREPLANPWPREAERRDNWLTTGTKAR